MKSLSIQFHGHAFLPDPSGALYWPAEQMLIVSDLHFEKSTYLASHGSLIAPYDTQDTLDRLEAVIEKYQPQRLLMLGDSFHDRHAWLRLDEALRARIRALHGLVAECYWVEGNHDVVLVNAEHTPLMDHTREGILFTHEPAPIALPQVVGHFHPKASLSLHGRKLRERCFVQMDRYLVMPAFGSYTGGLDVRHEAFTALAEDGPMQVYLLQPSAVYKIRG